MATSQDLRENPRKQLVLLSIFLFHLPETVVHISMGLPADHKVPRDFL